MDFDLGHELKLCSLLGQGGFLHDFDCQELTRLRILQLEASCEASFAQEFTFNVFLLSHLATGINNFLINCLKSVKICSIESLPEGREAGFLGVLSTYLWYIERLSIRGGT